MSNVSQEQRATNSQAAEKKVVENKKAAKVAEQAALDKKVCGDVWSVVLFE